LRSAENLEQGRLAVEARLMALGRAHDVLLQSDWAGANTTDVILNAIEPFNTKGAGRFVIHDANIEVGLSAVLPLTMALNELCTNAVKYGALSNGYIDIASTTDEKTQRFKLTWTEKSGPPVQKPTRRSFGTRLINRIADELRGQVRMSFPRPCV
jgi:two-component sensor histidine kinase